MEEIDDTDLVVERVAALDRMGGWGLLAHVSVGCRRESGPGR